MKRHILVWLAIPIVTLACGQSTGPHAASDLIDAGWSFGECVGGCRGALAVDARDLDYRITDWGGGQPILSNRGRLTDRGLSALAAIMSALPTTLEERYGCPDCADGGAAFLTVSTQSGPRRTTYEYGRPPAALSDADAFLGSVMDALLGCVSSPVVEVVVPCEPWARE